MSPGYKFAGAVICSIRSGLLSAVRGSAESRSLDHSWMVHSFEVRFHARRNAATDDESRGRTSQSGHVTATLPLVCPCLRRLPRLRRLPSPTIAARCTLDAGLPTPLLRRAPRTPARCPLGTLQGPPGHIFWLAPASDKINELETVTMMTASHTTVSYTHLDVYKRQLKVNPNPSYHNTANGNPDVHFKNVPFHN